ncbi:tight adherence pilus pseudopilin TadF [Methylophaga thalassica]|uniref:tight adherence pilus pseudopilin TadF n=1 Tax=Methylophaga aminisulfidivorans TaxID=230105 RepID=UPI003A913A20
MINSVCKQRGNFTVEFAIVGVFFSLLLVFSTDVIIKLSVKGKLDRMAFSAVSVIKERTQLFSESSLASLDQNTINSEASKAYSIVTASMRRTMGNFDTDKFGFVLYVRQGDSVLKNEINLGSITCSSSAPSKELSFTTTFGRDATLYQVVLCYDTDNWFGNLIGKDFSMVSSKAIIMGR